MGDETPKKSNFDRSITVPSSLPKPTFLPEPKSFSTKKERGTPPLRPPPGPQAKTCPPVSRVFKRRQELFAAQSVTFLDSTESSSLTGIPFLASQHYDSTNKASYFEQAFAIEEKIGAGCFGTVYKVRSKEDGKLYAVKIARERYRGLSDRKEKLEEVRKHQFLLPHSNCVHFYQSWEDNGRLYQKFELCQKSLMDVSEEKHDLPESLIWSYLVDLLLAIQHLHDHDLIHMDIKPENIFIGMDGICKLGDFGLVIDLAKMDSSVAVEGDPRYLATEILGERKFTKAADIFALGVTILELATDLDLPKHGQLWHQLRQTGPDPQLTKHLSQDLRLVVQLMMGNDHERRPTVKQLLELPAVKKAKDRRARELYLKHTVQSVKSSVESALWPLLMVVWMLITKLTLEPFDYVRKKIERCYHDSRVATPVQSSDGFLVPYPPKKCAKSNGVSFSSDEEQDLSSSQISTDLASPLGVDFSDEEEVGAENYSRQRHLYSNSNPRRSQRNLKNPKLKFEEPALHPTRRRQLLTANEIAAPGSAPGHLMASTPAIRLTPKTTAAQRFRTRYVANSTPTFSPKKKLDFEFHDSSDAGIEHENHEASPKLRSRSIFCPDPDQPMTPSSSRSCSSYVTNLEGSSELDEYSNGNSSSATIKPISLASKFDCFSDSD